jgi:hypothetical protein
MAYSGGKRPFEYASKSSHSHVVSDPVLQGFLEQCKMPTTGDAIEFSEASVIKLKNSKTNPVEHVIAVDGGYVEVTVKPQFPSATIAFLQCGALSFSVKDLDQIDNQTFIDPSDMSRLKNIERLKLALPSRGIRLLREDSFSASVRKTIFNFFCPTSVGAR